MGSASAAACSCRIGLVHKAQVITLRPDAQDVALIAAPLHLEQLAFVVVVAVAVGVAHPVAARARDGCLRRSGTIVRQEVRCQARATPWVAHGPHDGSTRGHPTADVGGLAVVPLPRRDAW